MSERVFVLAAMAAVSVMRGQTPLKFEVASVKPCRPDDQGPGGRSRGPNSPARLDLRCQRVSDLIETAYNFRANGKAADTRVLVPLEGGPAWTRSDRYTIDAVAEGNPGMDAMTGPMLRALLEERFQLKLHRETREVPVYALTVAKGGAKLRPHAEGSCIALDPSLPPGPPTKPFCGRAKGVRGPGGLTVQFREVTLDEFARNLGVNAGPQILSRPVVDKTGIAGVFDIDLTFSPDENNSTGLAKSDGPAAATDPTGTGASIFTAVQEQLGLRLESAKGPQEVLVIDRVERPSEN
jgi:uncharacterized protein (TIGR03435 family)